VKGFGAVGIFSILLLLEQCCVLGSPNTGFWGQRPPACQDFEEWRLFFKLDDFCHLLDSSSKVFGRQGPPAGQGFEK